MTAAVVEQIVREELNLHPPKMTRRELKLPIAPDLATVIPGMRRSYVMPILPEWKWFGNS